MRKHKRFICFALAAGMAVLLLTGCGEGGNESQPGESLQSSATTQPTEETTVPTEPLPTESTTSTQTDVPFSVGRDCSYYSDGSLSYESEITYDQETRIKKEEEIEYEKDGSVSYHSARTYTYDEDWHIIKYIVYYFDEASGYLEPYCMTVEEYQYDSQGNMTYEVHTLFFPDGNGGWIKDNSSYEAYYQKYGSKLLIVKQTYTNEDGVETNEHSYNPQGVITAFNARYKDGHEVFKTYEYNDRGLIARIEHRETIDGFTDTVVTEYEYNTQDRIVRILYGSENGWSEEEIYEYNEQGWLICERKNDGHDVIIYTYDGAENCVQVERISVYGGQIYEPYSGIFTPDSNGEIWDGGTQYYPFPEYHPASPDWNPVVDPN